MDIIQPFINNINTTELLADKKILLAKDNLVYKSMIFPESTNIQSINNKNNFITKIDNSFFDDFIILNKHDDYVYYDNNTKRDYIKSINIGDYNDSVKRYTNINKPIDYNLNSQSFLNLPNIENETVENSTIYNVNKISTSNISNNIFDNYKIPQTKKNIKYNDKTTLLEIFNWAKLKGIYFIYCIIEHRPYSINKMYTTPYVYYTIKGAYKQI